jgi:type IV secretory pathway VirB2 component (pilin)
MWLASAPGNADAMAARAAGQPAAGGEARMVSASSADEAGGALAGATGWAPDVTAARAARALETMLTAAVLGAAALLCLRPIDDPDLWWHLAAGRRILDGLGVPWTDPFSSVAGGNPWIAYSWLAEVVFAGLERALGLGALLPLAAGLFAATFGVVLRTCRVAGARHPVALAVTAAAILVSAPCRTVRPHLVSFLCMALACHWLVVDRQRRAARLWALVPTVALWANTHILFPFAFVVLAIHVAAGGRAWWHGRGPWRRAAPMAASLLASLLTPYGWHLLAHLPTMAAQPVALDLVSEFQSPSLHELGGQVLTLFFFATALVLILSPARKDPAELGSVLVFGLLAFAMRRNVPFFAIAAAPVLARHLDALLPPSPTRRDPGRPALLLVALALHVALVGTLGVALVRRATALWPAAAAVDRTAFPVDAVRFLAREPPRGRLFNDFDWGGYLIDHLHPRYEVSMDGRTQVYGEETLREYRALVRLEPDWRRFFDRCDPDVVLWPKRDAFARVLGLLPGWRPLYEDAQAVIFVRDGGSRPEGRGE